MYSATPQTYPVVNEQNFLKFNKKAVNKDSNQDEKNSLQCNICGLIISNKWNFTLHMRVHNNDRRYKCNQCSSAFITSHDLKRHTLAHDGRRPRFQCQFCPKTYASRQSKYLHEDTHNKLEYKCRHCSVVFSKFIDRKKHEKEVHLSDNTFYNCSECNKKFTSKKFLENHEMNYHKKEEDAFKCFECNMFFETSVSLNIHRRTHVDKTIVINEIDPAGYQNSKVKTFKKKTPIELFGIRIHECIICTKRYASRGDMLAHMTEAHPEENKAIFKYPCNMCDKFFKCKQGLTQHLITHTGQKKFSCLLCEYKSKRCADLKVHMRKHTGEAPYACDKCGKRFQQVKSFQHHKKQHFGKIFKCDMCDASFYRNRELDWHKQKHTEGGFKCYKCGKLLANPYSLKSHLKIGMCLKSSATSSKNIVNFDRQLCFLGNKSMKRINKSYECFLCGYSSLSLLDMTKHQVHHKSFCKMDNELNVEVDDPVSSSDSTIISKEDRFKKFFKKPPEKVDYNGKITFCQSDASVAMGNTCVVARSSDPDNDLSSNRYAASLAHDLQEKVIALDGKAFVSLEDLKCMDAETLSQYIKSLL